MAQQKREVTAIANQTATPTFDNTVVAMERPGCCSSAPTSRSTRSTAPTPTTRCRRPTPRPRRCSRRTTTSSISTPKLFQRFKYLHDHQAELNLNPEQAKLLDVYYKQFVHAGAELPPAKQTAAQGHQQAPQHAADRRSARSCSPRPRPARCTSTDASALAGLSPQQLAAAQEAAKDRKVGGYVLPLQNTTQQPSLESLTSHDTRQKLFEASLNRAEHGDANDTRAIVSEIAQLRAKKAALFGAANFADYNLYDQMAKDRATAVAFLDRLAPAVCGQGAAGMGRHRRAGQVAGRELPADRRPTGTSTPSRSASSATRSTATS